MKPKPLSLEKLAELEHIQWSAWTKYMLDNLTDENIKRWKRQIETPYAKLTEKEKESDREWARKVLPVIKSACEFYMRYNSNPQLLIEEHSEYKWDMWNCIDWGLKGSDSNRYTYDVQGAFDYDKYNEWLFKLVFKGVLK